MFEFMLEFLRVSLLAMAIIFIWGVNCAIISFFYSAIKGICNAKYF